MKAGDVPARGRVVAVVKGGGVAGAGEGGAHGDDRDRLALRIHVAFQGAICYAPLGTGGSSSGDRKRARRGKGLAKSMGDRIDRRGASFLVRGAPCL